MTTGEPGTRRSVAPAVVALIVLAGVALWLFWPRAAAGPVTLHGGTAGHRVELTVHRPRTGAGPVTVRVTDVHGRPAGLRKVTVEPVMQSMGHAAPAAQAAGTGPGSYRAESVSLFMRGYWEFTVVLQGATGADRVVFPLLITG
ncbi:hypothetical protein [Rhizohabitans arisaemae]|uniref:hypothetical protein n=1 Tax=Rhizohabitans arisaemae TaxID=2720610 RepID=UPI0024B0F71C|nr:hypothetical protein [Rhizohabitans arisaemae]